MAANSTINIYYGIFINKSHPNCIVFEKHHIKSSLVYVQGQTYVFDLKIPTSGGNKHHAPSPFPGVLIRIIPNAYLSKVGAFGLSSFPAKNISFPVIQLNSTAP